MNTTIFKSIGKIAKMVDDSINNQVIQNSDAVVSFMDGNNNKTFCAVDSILIDDRMLHDIEASSNGSEIIDTTKLNKVAMNLRMFEDKYGIQNNAYMMTGYSDINNFKVESISIDHSAGTYDIINSVIGIVSNGVLEMKGIVSKKVNI